jgi:hypothetical protein
MSQRTITALWNLLTTAAIMKIIAFRYIAPCSLFEVDRRFRGVYCLHHQTDKFITLMMGGSTLL